MEGKEGEGVNTECVNIVCIGDDSSIPLLPKLLLPLLPAERGRPGIALVGLRDGLPGKPLPTSIDK